MGPEKKFLFMREICDDPCQSYSDIQRKVVERKLQFAARKGHNSEVAIAFIVKNIPKVLSVEPCHQFIGDLDADLICELEDTKPVYIQVKTSIADGEKYKGKIARRRVKGIKTRMVVLSFEYPFEEIITQFVDQVNALEGRKLLKAVKF